MPGSPTNSYPCTEYFSMLLQYLFLYCLFQYPVLKQLFELRGHKSEIEDISCHPTEFKVTAFDVEFLSCVTRKEKPNQLSSVIDYVPHG